MTPSASRAMVESTTDRKSTRLNSSHSQISYAVFCLKKQTQRRLEQRFFDRDSVLARSPERPFGSARGGFGGALDLVTDERGNGTDDVGREAGQVGRLFF